MGSAVVSIRKRRMRGLTDLQSVKLGRSSAGMSGLGRCCRVQAGVQKRLTEAQSREPKLHFAGDLTAAFDTVGIVGVRERSSARLRLNRERCWAGKKRQANCETSRLSTRPNTTRKGCGRLRPTAILMLSTHGQSVQDSEHEDRRCRHHGRRRNKRGARIQSKIVH